MPGQMKEPQSYGSGRDWTTGKVGQEVTDQAAEPRPEHREFYDDRRESEVNEGDYQGGRNSPIQLAENREARGEATGSSDGPVPRVTTQEGGAKRDSYFRKRDYE
jgi:hypothetical protein